MVPKNCWKLFLLLMAFVQLQSESHGDEGLRPWAENPWYWSFNGKPVLMLGASDDDNLFQWPEELLLPHLNRMAEVGANVVRNTMSDRRDRGFELYPFYRNEDGKYDLERWNKDYWLRFDRFLLETKKRNIFVQIEVWDRFDFTDKQGSNRWQSHPYNPKNNVNYTYEESGFEKDYPEHPSRNLQPFFFTTPEQRNNQVVLRFQERFVDRLLDSSLAYSHLLYCIDNETKAEPQWGRYWANHIRGRAKKRGMSVMVTEMWDDWNLRAERHQNTFDHPELYDFVDISQNNQNSGRKHWDNFIYVQSYLAKNPRPINTTKTYGADGNKFGHSDQDAIERFWRHLLGGVALARFHRPPSGLGLSDKSAACIRAARLLHQTVPLWTLAPAEYLLDDCEPNEAYLAANTGTAYALYFPRQASVTIDLSALPAASRIEWIDVDSGSWSKQGSIVGNGKAVVESTRSGNRVAIISAADDGE